MSKITIDIDLRDPQQIEAAKSLLDIQHRFALDRLTGVKKGSYIADMAKSEAPKSEAPKSEAPKSEAPKSEAPKSEAPETVTLDDLRKLVTSAGREKIPAILAKLKELGADRLPALDESKFVEFREFLTTL